VPVGVGASTSENLLGDLDDVVGLVETLDFDAVETQLGNGQPLTTTQIRDVLRLVDELPDLGKSGTGLISDVSVAIQLRVWRIGFSAAGMFHGGALTNLDTGLLALGNSGIGTALGATGNAPATTAGQNLAAQLLGGGLVNAAQANEIAFQAEQAGVNLSDPTFQNLLDDVVQATTNNNGGSPANILTANQSGVNLRGALLSEVALGYSQPVADLLPFDPFNWVSVGAAVKAVYGTTYFKSVSLDGLDGFDDILDELTDDANREESVRFALDVGALVQPFDWLSLGLVARNVNEPEFRFAGRGSYEVEPQVRAGIGLHDIPFDGLILAADLDLTRNQTDALPGRESQVLGIGAEYDFLDMQILFLRFGVSQNLADTDEAPVIHGGLGVNFLGVSLDAAVMVSTETSEVGDLVGSVDELPERAGASFMLGVNVPLD